MTTRAKNGDFEDYGFMLGDILQQWESWGGHVHAHNVLDERYFASGEYTKGDAGYLSYGSPVAATLSLQIDF